VLSLSKTARGAARSIRMRRKLKEVKAGRISLAAIERLSTRRKEGIMTNRKLAYIVKDQKPLVLAAHETVQHACRCMGGVTPARCW
jgi:hypothetical protein